MRQPPQALNHRTAEYAILRGCRWIRLPATPAPASAWCSRRETLRMRASCDHCSHDDTSHVSATAPFAPPQKDVRGPQEAMRILHQHLAGRKWMLGGEFSLVD